MLCRAALLCLLAACGTSAPPERVVPVVRLRGSPEEIGRTHGRLLAPEIRTLYSRFLEAQVLPYLNRQQKSIHLAFQGLTPYATKAEYQNGRFAYQFLLDSARTLAKDQPKDYLAELDGIAAGSGIERDRIYVLNTFGDTLLGLLGLSFYLERGKAPQLVRVELPLPTDGKDNDFDGAIDEPDEAILSGSPMTQAAATGVPPGLLRLVLASPAGVDETSIQLRINGVPISNVQFATAGTETVLTFDTSPYWSSDWNTIVVQASDRVVIVDPPPAHPRTMRAARLVIGGPQARERSVNGDLHEPPGAGTSYAIASDDGTLMARTFVLLDANTAHDHTAVFIVEPTPTEENPTPRKYAFPGWAGAAWAFTGMNDAGQAVAVNTTETLDNGVVRGIEEAGLPRSRGVSLGAIGRQVLAHAYSPQEFVATMRSTRSAVGLIVQLADARRKTVTVCELRAAWKQGPSATCYGAQEAPAFRVGSSYSGIFSAYRAFAEDATGAVLEDLLGNALRLGPQRLWSTEWLQSYTTFAKIDAAVQVDDPGRDPQAWVTLMRQPGITSQRNAMHSAILLPDREMWVGLGRLPSSNSPFRRFSVKELFGQ